MRLPVLIALFAAITSSASAQHALDAAAFREDFRHLVTAIEQTHPDPYTAFENKIGFHRAAREYLERITAHTTLDEFRHLIDGFMARLEDGHTGLSVGTTGEDTASRKAFPLEFGIATDGVFVIRTTAAYQDHVGQRVLAIDSVPVDSVLSAVRRLVPSENAYGTYRNLLRLLRDDVSANRLFPTAGEGLSITFQTVTNDTMVTEIPFEEAVDFVSRPSRAHLGIDNGLLDWRVIGEGGVAYFLWNGIVSREVAEADARRGDQEAVQETLNWIYRYLGKAPRSGDIELDMQRTPSLYHEFSTLLREMKSRQAQYLILDLRRNGGGMTPLVRPLMYMLYGDRFLTHGFRAEYNTLLSPLFLAKFGMRDIEQYNEANGTDFNLGDYRFSYFWATDTSRSVEERRDIDNITYFGRTGAEYVEHLEGEPVYTPKIVVLTSPDTFSAAFHFMYFLWDMGGTVVVGVPPRQAGNAFMEVTPFTLPNSKLRGSISNAVQIFFPDDPERGKVFVPEFAMSWRDFAAYQFDVNAEVLYALDLIRSGRIAER